VRVLIWCTPGRGHFNPVVPFARALDAEGHHVAFASSEGFRPVIEKAGFEALAAGPDWIEDLADEVFPGFLSSTMPDENVRRFARIAGAAVDELADATLRWGADVLLRTPMAFAGWPAAERASVPHVVVGFMVPLPPEILVGLAGEELSALLAGAAAQADPGLQRVSGDLYLDLMPPALVPEQWPVPERRQVLRPAVTDGSRSETPSWLNDLEEPIVLVTFGTIHNQDPELWSVTLEALGGDVSVVAAYGPNRPPPLNYPNTGRLRQEPYIPFDAVLPRCRAAVTHGGYGTVIAALSFGVPLCCLPIYADNPVNAMAIELAGAGLACTTDGRGDSPFRVADPAKLDADQVGSTVRRLIEDPAFGERARAIGSSFATLPPLSEGVRRIAELLH
jgi:UDP:flavonoid glycosyltransferase YjiC (YdhE family)